MWRKQALSLFILLIISTTSFLKAQTMQNEHITSKQECFILISSFTANGDTDKLKHAIIKALEAGLSINEIKETMIQLYAYTGFPRSLNALGTLKNILDEREKQGIKDVVGKEASPIPTNFNKDEYGARVRANFLGQKEIPSPSGYQLFAPTIDTFLKEHLFADIFVRDILNHQTRELITISALASMIGTESQLQAHLGICLNVGWCKEQLEAFTVVLEKEVGIKETQSARNVLTLMLKNRK
jgi:alkylhydroperoxidase/carboxymuconolactone decarboxylase family protein YurZ